MEPGRHPGLDDSGHALGKMNQSAGALFMMSFMILVLGTVYLGWRVYTKKKYFTKDWVKTNEHGLQLMEK